MADVEKIVLLEVDIKMDDAIDAQKRLSTAITDAKQDAEKLKASEGELSEAYIRKQAEIKSLTKELNSQKAITEKVVTSNNSATGSIDQMRAQLAVVSKQWSALSKEERLNSEEGKKLTAQKLQLTDALKKEEKATGDTRRNVGNYSEMIGNLPGKMGGVISGFLGMAKAAWAFIATPIGAILAAVVLAIGAVVSIFKKFDPLLDKIEQGIAAVSAVISVLKNSFLAFFTGTKSLTESFSGLGDAMKDAANRAIELKKSQQDLADQQTLMIEAEAKTKRQIDELLLQSKDRAKSDKERIELIDQALKLEEESYNKKKGFAEAEYNQAVEQLAIDNQLTEDQKKNLTERGASYVLSLMQTKAISEDEFKAFAEISAKREQVLNESIVIREKAINRQNALLEKQDVDEKKRLEKAKVDKEKETERLKAENDKRIKDAENYNKTVLDVEQSLLELKEQRRREAVKVEQDEKKKERELERERLAADYENEAQIRILSNENRFNLEREQLKEQRNFELEQAKKTGADIELIYLKYSLSKREIDKIETEAKLSTYGNMAGQLAELFGKQTKLGKIAAAAQTAVNTYLGAQAAFAQTPGGIVVKSIAAGLATAVGLKNISKIWAVKSGLPGDGGGGQSIDSSVASGGASVNPTIGQGIVSRSTPNQQGGVNINTQPTLVIDKVTAAQQQQERMNVTQSL